MPGRWLYGVALALALSVGTTVTGTGRCGRRLERGRRSVAGRGDGVLRRRVGDLPLQPGQLPVVRRNRLLETMLHISRLGRIRLLLRSHQLGRLRQLCVQPVERLVGKVDAVAGDHRLRLSQSGAGQLEVISETVRWTECQESARLLERPLYRIERRIGQAIRRG